MTDLIREMPVELYVKFVGSELPLERVSDLTQDGARVKDCTPKELEREFFGHQAMTRLSNTIDMMRRMDVSNFRLFFGSESNICSRRLLLLMLS